MADELRYYLVTSDYLGDGDYSVKVEGFDSLERVTEIMAMRDLSAFDCALFYGRRVAQDEYGPLFIEQQTARNQRRQAESEAGERALYASLKAKYEGEASNGG